MLSLLPALLQLHVPLTMCAPLKCHAHEVLALHAMHAHTVEYVGGSARYRAQICWVF